MEGIDDVKAIQNGDKEAREAFIEKNRVRATSAKQAQSRVKMLEHITRLERPVETKDISFKFPVPSEFTEWI